MCPNQPNYITQVDFDCVGIVAKHCDLPKLCIAISEASEFDLSELFCDFWPTALEIFAELEAYDEAVAACEADPDCETPPTEPTDYELKVNLICGGSFEGCNDRTRTHSGLRKAWVYYAYSRYLVLNGFNDTANGQVTKTNEWSLPKPLKEVQSFADKYRSMAYTSLKKTMGFLCVNKDTFATFNSNVCEPCGCGGNCKGETKANGYGINGTVIRKTTTIKKRYGGL